MTQTPTPERLDVLAALSLIYAAISEEWDLAVAIRGDAITTRGETEPVLQHLGG